MSRAIARPTPTGRRPGLALTIGVLLLVLASVALLCQSRANALHALATASWRQI
jgi:hypothetical protein